MEYYTYKLQFNTGIHVGRGSLSDNENTILADTLFSALCHEAIAFKGKDGIEELVDYVYQDKLVFSDLLPYIGNELYIPKPMCIIKGEAEGDSVVKKNFKKLKYIPISKLDTYLLGELNPIEENDKQKKLGMSEIRTMSSFKEPNKMLLGEVMPFDVGVYRFAEDNGLYTIAGFKQEHQRELFEELLTAVSYSGIGGKRSSGFGQFSFENQKLDESIEKRLGKKKNVISLSVSMATPEEMTSALENARYVLIKRSGFISSGSYSETPRRKKDFYSFKSGSYFQNDFHGDIFDVSGRGSHPVYRYAKPLFMEVQ